MAPITGIDVSRHQGVVDYEAVRRAGHTFAFIKATDGVQYKHIGWFHTNAPRVKAAGLVLGAYHFLLDHHSGAAQARYYVDQVGKSGGFRGVVPIVDIEREADGTTPRIGHLRDFVAEFRRLVPGREILIYTGKWYWVGVLGNPHGADLGPLWHSEYDGLTPLDHNVADGPELDSYGGWTDCLVWQHTSSGSCPGVAGRCDLNIFYGDRAQLAALAGVATPPASEPPKEIEMKVIDCPGRPALSVGADGIQRINGGQRSALLAIGVPVQQVDQPTSDALWSLHRTFAADVDEAALAAVLGPLLADAEPGTLTGDEVEARVRQALADVHAAAAAAAT